MHNVRTIRKLNLGCGTKILAGYENYDKEVNLDKKLKFKDNSIDYILIEDVLEHVNNPEYTLSELKRILKIGGILEIHVPHYRSPCAYMVQHKTYYSWQTFNHYPWYFDEQGFKVIKNTLTTFFNIPIPMFFPPIERIIPTVGIRIKMRKEKW